MISGTFLHLEHTLIPIGMSYGKKVYMSFLKVSLKTETISIKLKLFEVCKKAR